MAHQKSALNCKATRTLQKVTKSSQSMSHSAFSLCPVFPHIKNLSLGQPVPEYRDAKAALLWTDHAAPQTEEHSLTIPVRLSVSSREEYQGPGLSTKHNTPSLSLTQTLGISEQKTWDYQNLHLHNTLTFSSRAALTSPISIAC